MPMDELHQTDDFPDNNMSKNAFWLLQTYIEAITRPMMQIREILFATDSIFIGRYKAAYILLVYMTE